VAKIKKTYWVFSHEWEGGMWEVSAVSTNKEKIAKIIHNRILEELQSTYYDFSTSQKKKIRDQLNLGEVEKALELFIQFQFDNEVDFDNQYIIRFESFTE